MFLWRSTKEVKVLCPTTFVVDATENSKKGGEAAEVCSSQRLGWWTKSKGNILLLLPGSPKWSHFRRGNLWTLSNQHHPPPTNVSVWSGARQRKILAKWVGGYRSAGVGHQAKKYNPGVNKYVQKKATILNLKKNQHTSATTPSANKHHQPWREMQKKNQKGTGVVYYID